MFSALHRFSKWGVINELKNCLGDVVKEVPIPEGRSEEELWQIFDICVAQVAEGDQIILDVTHGFRSLPYADLRGCRLPAADETCGFGAGRLRCL